MNNYIINILCEGNLAYDQPAEQSSTYWPFGADKAVDGNVGPVLNNGHCSHTWSSYNAWLRVDLGEMAYVINVTIYNRKSGTGKLCYMDDS